MGISFRHRDSDATILFGPGVVEQALDELIEPGFLLLSTRRAIATKPLLAERARRVVEVPDGQIPAVAGALQDEIGGEPLLAFGGGRVIDAAKAVAAAEGAPGPVAVPTSLSGAEMTGVHRHAEGVAEGTPRSRPRLVLNDPGLSASQPPAALAASSANALGHAATAAVDDASGPLARAVAVEAVSRLAAGWGRSEPGRAEIALGALLAGWAVDRSGLGPHHALTQTVVRIGGIAHAGANAAILPHTLALMRERRPKLVEAIDMAAGAEVEELAGRLRRCSRATLSPLAADPVQLADAAATAARRSELERLPPALSQEQIEALYRAAAGA